MSRKSGQTLRQFVPGRVTSSGRFRLTWLAFATVVIMLAAAHSYGVMGETERVSVASDGSQATGGDSNAPEISADGRYVAFYSDAIDLVVGDTNGDYDVFVHDRETGVMERVSISSTGTQTAGGSQLEPAISGDGRYVAFHSTSASLVAGDTNGLADIFVRDRTAGTTERVSISSGGTQTVGGGSESPDISADGRYVTFNSEAINLVAGDTNGQRDIFVHDRQAGTTERVSVASDGSQSNGLSSAVAISADGRYVTFYSDATDLVADDTNGKRDIFVHDRDTGTTERVSVTSSGAEANGISEYSAISADGRYVAFRSDATTLVAGDTNGSRDVFVHDRITGITECVSVTSAGIPGTGGHSGAPSLSTDGRYVAFRSKAVDLVTGDTNGKADIFVRDRETSVTVRVSVASDGTEGDQNSGSPSITADGRHVAFGSLATVLVTNDTNGFRDIFVHDFLGDVTPPTTTDDIDSPYEDEAVISLTATDTGGSGVATTYYSLDGGQITTYTAPIAVNDIGDHSLLYWSVDTVGNVEMPQSAPFTVAPHAVTFIYIEGPRRYETAVEVSRRAYPAGTDTVIIATGRNWPDALSGSALAGAYDAPILLSGADSLTAATANEITRLKATSAIILGGVGAVPRSVEADLVSAGIAAGNITRLGGPTRYETAEIVAQATMDKLGGSYDAKAFVATGANFPDALAGSSLAAANGWPIYLASPHRAPGLLASTMEADGVTDALILGGTGVVSSAYETKLGSTLSGSVDRLAGDTRYTTAVDVATYGVSDAGLGWDNVAIVTGQNFPDALAGGVLQGRDGSVMLLTPTAYLHAAAKTTLGDNASDIYTVRFIGGTGAVSQSVRDEVVRLFE